MGLNPPTPQSWHTGGFRDKKCVNFVNFVNFEAVLYTMNIEGQIHQKNPGMGQTPPFLAMPGFWKLWLVQSLPYVNSPKGGLSGQKKMMMIVLVTLQ